MSFRSKTLRSGVALGAGQLFSRGLGFLANVILARRISTDDYGIAAFFVVTVVLMDAVSDLNLGTMLIQSEDGEDPAFQKTAHALTVCRGLFLGVIVYALATPLSLLFGVAQARAAFQCLALYPVLQGLVHHDLSRLQRQMDFRPLVASDVLAQLTGVLCAWPLAAWLHSYWAMLWVMLIQLAMTTLLSHLLARRRYRLRWDARHARKMVAFSWPLVVSGCAMFLIYQGDCSIIGAAPRLSSRAHYTTSDLAMYSVAFTLAQMPALMLTKMMAPLTLPLLARAKDESIFLRRYRLCAELLAVCGGLTSILFILCGRTLVLRLYGPRYTGAVVFIGWLTAMQTVRLIRRGATVAALAKGDSRNSMVSNVMRVAGFIGSAAFCLRGASLVWVAVCGLVGEALATLVSTIRLRRVHGVPMALCWRPIAYATVGMIVAAVAAAAGGTGMTDAGLIAVALTALAAASLYWICGVLLFPSLRSEARVFVDALWRWAMPALTAAPVEGGR